LRSVKRGVQSGGGAIGDGRRTVRKEVAS